MERRLVEAMKLQRVATPRRWRQLIRLSGVPNLRISTNTDKAL
jgi:hypothetical protein